MSKPESLFCVNSSVYTGTQPGLFTKGVAMAICFVLPLIKYMFVKHIFFVVSFQSHHYLTFHSLDSSKKEVMSCTPHKENYLWSIINLYWKLQLFSQNIFLQSWTGVFQSQWQLNLCKKYALDIHIFYLLHMLSVLPLSWTL